MLPPKSLPKTPTSRTKTLTSEDCATCGLQADQMFGGRPICHRCFADFMSRNDRMEKCCKISMKQGEPLKYEKVNAINGARDRYDLRRRLRRSNNGQ